VKRILLADDSAVVRRSVRQMFEEAGWCVCGEASDGQEAIAKAHELRPNIVVLDLSMPQVNGLTAGRILKEILPGTRLILFTAFGALLTTQVLESAGFSALISKNDAGRLLNTAQTLLDAA
jgi:DNA-binding NarL/FixJ family response regulator